MAFSISSFSDEASFKEYTRIFNEELSLRAGMLTKVKNHLGYKDRAWDQLSDGFLDFVRRVAEDVTCKTDAEFDKQFSDGRSNPDPLFISRHGLKDAIKDALKELANDTYLEPQ